MFEMIAAEIFKASRKKRFWIVLALFIVISPAFQLISAYFVNSRVAGSAFDTGSTVSDAVNQIASPYNLSRNSIGGLLPLMLFPLVALMSVFLVGEERTFKMWKTILVANPDRIRVVIAKFVTGMLLLAVIIFGGLLGSLVFGTIATMTGLSKGFDGDWTVLLATYFLQWLVLAAPLALGFLIAWWTASPAIAVIGVVVLPALIENLVRVAVVAQTGILSPLSAPLEAARVKDQLENIPKFFLTPNVSIGSRLLGQDASNLLGNSSGIAGVIPKFEWSEIGWSVAVAGVYFLLFAGITIWSFTNRDIHE